MSMSSMSNFRNTRRGAIRISLLVFSLFLLSSSSLCSAQQASTSTNTGSIRGTVVDSKTLQPLNGATVGLRGLQAGGEGNSTVTASDGAFSFARVAPGRYRVTASHNGYVDTTGGRGAYYGSRGMGTIFMVAAGQDV